MRSTALHDNKIKSKGYKQWAYEHVILFLFIVLYENKLFLFCSVLIFSMIGAETLFIGSSENYRSLLRLQCLTWNLSIKTNYEFILFFNEGCF